ncbi:MAG: RimK/LysX family protein [Syntrophorhabdaceae bacterium]|nr:RimK/LysX family protein [Syntrophorhabdaceae bacterium]
MNRKFHALLTPVLSFLLILAAYHVQCDDKLVVGEVEEIILIRCGKKMPARIDTGATITSIDARDLKIKNDIAEFRLPEKYGGEKITLPIVEWQLVRSSSGQQKRPVVEIDICIGTKKLRIKANLSNRSCMSYPILIGRNVLKEGFIVDITKKNILPPDCSQNTTP